MKSVLRLGSVLVALIAIVMLLQVIASESGEVVVLTTRDETGGARDTRLWVVDHDGSAWLRSGSPESGWYRRLLANPEVGVRRGETSFAAIAQPVAGERDAVNDRMGDKYGWADDFIGVLYGRDDAIPIRLITQPD